VPVINRLLKSKNYLINIKLVPGTARSRCQTAILKSHLTLTTLKQVKKIGRNNGGGVSIETGGIINDLSITQEIVLNPTRFYRLSAWIKTENVEEGAGANVCLFGT
jgi:hypothetical protein